MERKLKDSGIPWIGEIPEHWKIARIKDIYSFQTGATPPSKTESFYDGDYLWANIGDIDRKTIFETSKHLSDEGIRVCSMNVSPKGSLLYSFKLSVGQVAFCGVDMYTNEAIATFIGEPTALSYLYYVAPLFIVFNANTNIYGAPILNQDLIKNAIIPIPPLAEQEAIAAYLDKKCGEIDELIEVEQQMISDLESYRQSVITEAVTHGLKPDASYKTSNIPWISSIPSNWKEIRLKFLSKIATGDKDTIMATDEGEYPFFVRSPKVERINTYSYDGEAILMAGDGVGAGRIFHHYKGKFDWHQRVYNLHELKNTIGRFLYYFLLSNFHKLIDAGSAKSTVDSVRLPMLTNFIVLVPPLSEQQEIADYLDAKCAEIDELIKVKQEKIETLKQYRQSLIFEAVTGKTTIE